MYSVSYLINLQPHNRVSYQNQTAAMASKTCSSNQICKSLKPESAVQLHGFSKMWVRPSFILVRSHSEHMLWRSRVWLLLQSHARHDRYSGCVRSYSLLGVLSRGLEEEPDLQGHFSLSLRSKVAN